MTAKIVITLHGIRTRGVWQKDLVPLLARAGFIPYLFDYDYFSASSLISASRRENKVRWFVEQYELVRAATGVDRPSVIAHSFGTYIVAAALEHNPEIKFDKIIFCGSIVREDFDWPTVIGRRQVNYVENDFGRLDVWPRWAKMLIEGTGNAGTLGFNRTDAMLVQREFPKYKHSDYFSRTHFERFWIRALLLDMRRLRHLLAYLVEMTSSTTGVAAKAVRAYIFVPEPSRQFLRIPGDLHVGLLPGEALRTVPVDIDGVVSPGIGECFSTERATLVQVKADFRWNLIPTSSDLKPHQALSWLISIPIFDEAGQITLGVLCVDGLEPAPDERLAPLIEKMVPFTQQVGKMIAPVESWL